MPAGWNWFWADNRPNGGGYHGHYISGGWTTDTQVVFIWQGSGAWNVYRGGSYIGESTHNGDFAEGGAVGAESTTGAMALQGHADNFEYHDSSWHGAGGGAEQRKHRPYQRVHHYGQPHRYRTVRLGWLFQCGGGDCSASADAAFRGRGTVGTSGDRSGSGGG